MSGLGAQDVIALAIVAVVAGLVLWRRARRRRAGPGCTDCAAGGGAGRKEVPLRFHRRRPGGPGGTAK